PRVRSTRDSRGRCGPIVDTSCQILPVIHGVAIRIHSPRYRTMAYPSRVTRLQKEIDELAEATAFCGVVRVDRGDELVLEKAYGMAHRGLQVPNTVDTQFGLASAVKGMTAIAVVSLIVDGALDLSTPARAVLGSDLPLIADDVTIEHLLAQRSGIGDYLDEDTGYEISDYMMPISVHRLATTEQFLPVLDGHPTKFPAGRQFSYCNGGFM